MVLCVGDLQRNPESLELFKGTRKSGDHLEYNLEYNLKFVEIDTEDQLESNCSVRRSDFSETVS